MEVEAQAEIYVRFPKIIVLLGKTGNGKSATGNTLLQRNVFEESDYQMSKTKLLTLHSTDDLVVYDTKGPFDVETKEQESALDASKELKMMIENCLRVDVFVLVLNAQSKFSKEEQNTVDLYKNILGHDFIKNNGILVMTRGENITYQDNFQEWCDKQTGYFKDLMTECNNRIVIFFNKGSTSQKSQCRAELLKIMKSITCSYTLSNFNQNATVRNSYVAKLNRLIYLADFNGMLENLKLKVEKLEKSKERTPLDIDIISAEIREEKTFLDHVKTNDDDLTKESKDLSVLYNRVKKIKTSPCVIQ